MFEAHETKKPRVVWDAGGERSLLPPRAGPAPDSRREEWPMLKSQFRTLATKNEQ